MLERLNDARGGVSRKLPALLRYAWLCKTRVEVWSSGDDFNIIHAVKQTVDIRADLWHVGMGITGG
jgi:hypothetical protein